MSQIIFGAWIASGVVLFLPLGAVLRIARRSFGRLRPAGRTAEAVAAGGPGSADEVVAPPATERGTPRWAGRLSKWTVGLVLYAAFVIGAVYYTPELLSRALDTEHPMASVTSSSMWPTLKKGDLVVLKGVSRPEDIRAGDVIAFEHEEGFAIHRVIQVDGKTITTRGDANPVPDEPITFDKVIGRVPTIAGHLVKIPYLGNIPILVHPASDEADQGGQESSPGESALGASPARQD